MELAALCAVAVALRVLPNRSQFFQYESVTLSCGPLENSSDWSVMRNTSRHRNQECFTSKDCLNKSHSFIDTLYPSDTGLYWCESAAGEQSAAVSITVTRGPVILQSPDLPVTAGDDVTLSCTEKKTNSTSGPAAEFYKDGRLLWGGAEGSLTLRSVSVSDGGVYRCNIPGVGESPESRLTVRGKHSGPSNMAPALILLPVVAVILLLFVMLLCFWRRRKGKVNGAVSYTDVTIAQEVAPQRKQELDATSTFYSLLKPVET